MRLNRLTRLLTTILLILFSLTALNAAGRLEVKKLDRFITEAMKITDQPGLAVAVVKDGKVVFMKGYGERNLADHQPVTPQTLFNIASLSKAFTAALAGIAVETGELDWDLPVTDVLPWFRLEDPWISRHLTLRDLLSHRTGLGTFDGDLLWYASSYSTEEVIRRMAKIPLRRQFRSQFGYQNNTYLVAGEMLRQAGGKTWGETLQEQIFKPLSMSRSRCSGSGLTPGDDLALPYISRAEHPYFITTEHSAASIFTSVEEMTHWMVMLLNRGQWQGRQVLSEAMIETLFTPNIAMPVSKRQREAGTYFRTYALGWGVSDYRGRRRVEHSGGMPGYLSLLTLIPEEGLGMVTLINDMNDLTRHVHEEILDAWLAGKPSIDRLKTLKEGREAEAVQQREADEKLEKSRLTGTSPRLGLDAYAGAYEDPVYGLAQVEHKEGCLQLTLLPTAALFTSPLEHWHHDTFRIRFKDLMLPPGFVTFSFDSAGRVTGFKIDLKNPDLHFHQLDFRRLDH